MADHASESAYRLGFTTLTSERSIEALPLQGKLPSWLTGTLVRTGPARFEVGESRYNHWFDGLAMLHSFAFSGGRVAYDNRYLRSRAYEGATAEGRISRPEFATDPCRTLFQRVTSWFSPRGITDNCCVNVAHLGDAVVALTETRLPIRFDPHTLATLGPFEYDRHVKGPVSTAHPHHDRARERHYNYTLDFGRTSSYRFFDVARNGRQSALSAIPVRRPAYVHSFGMSERYLILAEFPLVVDPLKLRLSGKPFIRNYRWRPERGVQFHVIEKSTGRVVRTARSEAFFAFHHVNAFERGDELFVDMVCYPDATAIDQLYLDRLRSADPVIATGELHRFRISPSGDARGERMSDAAIELTRFDYDRRAGDRYRYVYGAGNAVTGNFLDCLVKLDLDRGTASRWQEEGCYPGEPVFVAAPGTDVEDSGVVLSVVLDTRASASFLLILDASTFAELGRASAPHHIPLGFHGMFLANADLVELKS